MKRYGRITLVELLIVIAIIGVLVSLIGGGVGGCGLDVTGYYSQKNTGVYQCVKTYTVSKGDRGRRNYYN